MPTPKPQQAELTLEAGHRCEHFLFHEAGLLDDNLLHDWLALLTRDIEYLVPVRITRERSGGSGFSERAYHMRDNYTSLTTRVARLDSEYAWAEDPPSRTRRLVTNVRADSTDHPDEYEVRSNLLMYRGRYDSFDHQVIAGERRDVLRNVDGRLLLAKRTVLLDQTTLATHNLAVLL